MLPRAVGPACRPLACCNGQDTSSCSAGTWPSDLHDGRSIGGALKTPAQTCRLDSPLLTCWEGAAPGLAPPHAAAAATLMQCQARSAHVYARGGSHSSDLARLRMLDSHEQARRLPARACDPSDYPNTGQAFRASSGRVYGSRTPPGPCASATVTTSPSQAALRVNSARSRDDRDRFGCALA